MCHRYSQIYKQIQTRFALPFNYKTRKGLNNFKDARNGRKV